MVSEVKETEKIKPVLVRHAEFAFYPTREESLRVAALQGAKNQHLRPDSIYVTAIGTSWEEGAWQKVIDMVAYTNDKGYCCWFKEIEDSFSQLPYGALNPMRNVACLDAVNVGCEYVLLVENDILPEPDMLIKLIQWQAPVVLPYCIDNKTDKPLMGPTYKPNMGLQPVEWAVFSCILIKTSVLHCFPDCAPFRDCLKESTFFKKLTYYGHKGFVDTNTPLQLATRPTYGGECNNINETWKFYEMADRRRRTIPNRRSTNPNETSLVADVYVPKTMKDGMEKKNNT